MDQHHRPAPSHCQFGGIYVTHGDHYDELEPECSAAPEYVTVLNPDRPDTPGRCPHCGGLPKMALCERHTRLHLERVPYDHVLSVTPFKYSDEELEYMARLAELEEQFRE